MSRAGPSISVDVEYPQRENTVKNSVFSQAFPSAVRDTLQVVRNLGARIRYFWVDCYCIQQDGDEIYEAAEATIVAAYGGNDETGLLGLSAVTADTTATPSNVMPAVHLIVPTDLHSHERLVLGYPRLDFWSA